VFLTVDPDGSKVALKIPASETVEGDIYRHRFILEEWIA
jgi:hypothetical protein